MVLKILTEFLLVIAGAGCIAVNFNQDGAPRNYRNALLYMSCAYIGSAVFLAYDLINSYYALLATVGTLIYAIVIRLYNRIQPLTPEQRKGLISSRRFLQAIGVSVLAVVCLIVLEVHRFPVRVKTQVDTSAQATLPNQSDRDYWNKLKETNP